MIKKIVLPLLIIAAAVMIFMLMKATQTERSALERPERAWLVNAQAAKFETLSPQIILYGRVETSRISSLTTAVEADVQQIHVLDGDRVRAGDVLIELDDADVRLLQQQAQADVDEAQSLLSSERQRYQRDQRLLEHEKSLLALAERAAERARTLEQSRLAAQVTVDEALANVQRQHLTIEQLEYDLATHPQRMAQLNAALKRAEAMYAKTLLDLQRTQIKAPFDGRVARLQVSQGDRAREGQSLMTVYDLSELEIRAQIPGRFITTVRQLLQQGSQLEAIAIIDQQSFPLRLNRLAGEVRDDTGGIEGLFRFDHAGEQVSLGQFAELHLQMPPQQQVLALPFSALYGLDRVYRVVDQQMYAVQVERVGEFRDANGQRTLLVRSQEIAPGDQIVTTQLPNAINGLRVNIHAD